MKTSKIFRNNATQPKKTTYTELMAAVEEVKDNQLCILGDFNEVLGKDPTLMASVCTISIT